MSACGSGIPFFLVSGGGDVAFELLVTLVLVLYYLGAQCRMDISFVSIMGGFETVSI